MERPSFSSSFARLKTARAPSPVKCETRVAILGMAEKSYHHAGISRHGVGRGAELCTPATEKSLILVRTQGAARIESAAAFQWWKRSVRRDCPELRSSPRP